MSDDIVSVRRYQPTDLDAVITIFLRAVREVAIKDYTQAQIDAWAQVDREKWSQRRLSRPTWVAIFRAQPVGFADLESTGHLDMMFVHPSFQRMGVARLLLREVERDADRQGLSRIFTEASITARPFFEKHGFRVEVPQLVEVRGQVLRNFKMAKLL